MCLDMLFYFVLDDGATVAMEQNEKLHVDKMKIHDVMEILPDVPLMEWIENTSEYMGQEDFLGYYL